MTEFVAFDPAVESKGAAILATLRGVSTNISGILEKNGLDHVESEAWYPQQAWLDTLRDIARLPQNSLELVGIGLQIPETADWPQGITSVTAALESINVAYHMNHRYGEVGFYAAEQLAENEIRVVCENPFPSDFDYGIIYAVARRFREANRSYYVARDDSPCRKNGDARCIYHVVFDRIFHFTDGAGI